MELINSFNVSNEAYNFIKEHLINCEYDQSGFNYYIVAVFHNYNELFKHAVEVGSIEPMDLVVLGTDLIDGYEFTDFIDSISFGEGSKFEYIQFNDRFYAITF